LKTDKKYKHECAHEQRDCIFYKMPNEFATRMMLNECFRPCRQNVTSSQMMNTIAPTLALVARAKLESPSEVALQAKPRRCVR